MAGNQTTFTCTPSEGFLAFSWKDKVDNASELERAGYNSIHTLHTHRRLRWWRIIVRIGDERSNYFMVNFVMVREAEGALF